MQRFLIFSYDLLTHNLFHQQVNVLYFSLYTTKNTFNHYLWKRSLSHACVHVTSFLGMINNLTHWDLQTSILKTSFCRILLCSHFEKNVVEIGSQRLVRMEELFAIPFSELRSSPSPYGRLFIFRQVKTSAIMFWTYL